MSEISRLHKINQCIDELPQPLAALIRAEASTPYSFFPKAWVENACQRLDLTREALGLALLPIAAAFAEAPVSQFYVGAVAFDSDGNAYLGANFEFAHTHMAQVIHAEQSAIAHAWQRGARALDLLVVNYAPCGHCRQFINEVRLTEHCQILLPEQQPQPLAAYLPNAFGPQDLGIDARILDGFSMDVACDDLFELASIACEKAHAPYSGSLSGIALEYADGERVVGRYAENAAFNPSLPALQVAINARHLQGKDWKTITKAVMVERQSMLSQRANAEALLHTIDVKLAYKSL